MSESIPQKAVREAWERMNAADRAALMEKINFITTQEEQMLHHLEKGMTAEAEHEAATIERATKAVLSMIRHALEG